MKIVYCANNVCNKAGVATLLSSEVDSMTKDIIRDKERTS